MQKGDMAPSREGNRSQIEQKLFEIREEHSDIIRKIKLYNKEYSSMVDLEVSETQELISGIDPGVAFLCYWVEKDHIFIWMITSDGIESRTVPIGEEEIFELVADGRRTVSSSRHKAVYFQLYQKLIKPFEEAIKSFETLCIIPHLELHFLPFQCLMPDSNTYLIDNHNVFYTPSLNVYSLTRIKKLEPEKSFFAMALGELELGGLSGLPGTTREVSLISEFFSEPTVTYEHSSTESFFKNSVKSFEFVHVATHGMLLKSQPMYSHLILAPSKEDDGLLTVGEIFGLRMNADLVVLSACVTGLGSLNNGDEIIGLSRAFLYAGSKDVIVSLWNVADEATVFLMTQFYKNMATSNPVQSLRHAQIATRKKYSNPVHWAPFQLIGSGF